jgi:hypothetical protein
MKITLDDEVYVAGLDHSGPEPYVTCIPLNSLLRRRPSHRMKHSASRPTLFREKPTLLF